MDVFDLRNHLVGDYEEYVSSFINIQDPKIREYVEEQIAGGLLWPDPLIQLNPSFQPGHTVEDLAKTGDLHPECEKIFRIRKGSSEERVLRMHTHQEEAVRAALDGKNYILTTGTGSGKSLAYIIPIVNHVLQNGTGKGIQAIIVYPMNALANSQLGELEKFINLGYPDNRGPVSFARFTGQESDEQKNAIRANPPDILLTNYVMLELILTRPEDRKSIIHSASGLQFLVLDELHTYRGRQGADVAMLIRRLREAVNSPRLQCVGTSATLASEGSYADQQRTVADMATMFFGTNFDTDNIIGETLTRGTKEYQNDDPGFIDQLAKAIRSDDIDIPDNYENFIVHPLVSWIESTFGLSREPGTDRLIRAIPISITGDDGAGQKLAAMVGIPLDKAIRVITQFLMKGYQIQHPETDFPVFAFRLHQFISPGDTVYATLESPDVRYPTVNNQQYMPGDRSKILLPLAFCRECGQEYYSVQVIEDQKTGDTRYIPRDFMDMLRGTDDHPGFLYISEQNPWPTNEDEILDRLPDDWKENHGNGERVLKGRRKYNPRPIIVDTDGTDGTGGLKAAYFDAPFRFCLNCGVSYSTRLRSDFSKLSSLSTGGRSTATTILSLSTYQQLIREDYLEQKARKLLSFTDNRQDAALQAGHFNDFVETSLLRAALYKAVVDAGEKGLRYDGITHAVEKAFNLPLELYAREPEVKFAALIETNEALRDVLGYRLYRDLRKGWRVTAPNLEQSGLLKIEYLSLDDVCKADDVWNDNHHALTSATPETRKKIAQVLLDFMRRELAIQVNYLDVNYKESLQNKSTQRLISPWAIDENEKIETAKILYPRSKQTGDYQGNLFLSARGGFGLYLNNRGTFDNYDQKLDLVERDQIIIGLLEALRIAGIVEIVDPAKDDGGVHGYQLKAAAMIWKASDGTIPFHDPIRIPQLPDAGAKPNQYFVRFYQEALDKLKGLQAREHTAQVPYDEREKREHAFREGRLPILFCSPTMELGIDISQLNVVNMRNVPPTPANYAQRSGRAGRSGQPALVFTYCSKGSPHDQYFFKRQPRMVAGVVSPPRIDLDNDDLIRAHVHAIWLAETDLKLGTSLRDILAIEGDPPPLDLNDSVKDALTNTSYVNQTQARTERILKSIEPYLTNSDWYQRDWLNQVLVQIPKEFNKACDRWKDLYKAASQQRDRQNAIIKNAVSTSQERDRAKRLRREAENQIDILIDTRRVMQSDFYIYRYMASEGFLPGYNFPRLPLSAYIPARRVKTDDGDYLSRPRFLAISEFGPRSIVYHEGSRYVINRVIMQVGRVEEEDNALATERAKLCPHCGYLHYITQGDGVDLCENCHNPLDGGLRSLYRMRNVSTKRRDRINSDEEERFRLGYEIQTAVRFHQDNGHIRKQSAEVTFGDQVVARLEYGDAATIWRINLGWRRRQNQEQHGFVLDIDHGYWQRNDAIEDDPDDPMSQRTQRVIPYVEDHKNAMLFAPQEHFEPEQMASLTAALKSAIQIVYQLEDNELSAEPLPTGDDRRVILFYESAEGGAGVLRQIVNDPGAFAEIARAALEICHFDPDTGEDLRKAPNSDEECEAACYDCLMSYYNQRDHRLLDRLEVLDILMTYKNTLTKTSPVAITRDDHYTQLRRLCQSELEEKWLDYLQTNGYRLPSKAQQLIRECSTRPDFLYENEYVAIYIDGYHHLNEGRRKRDAAQTECMENNGYTVLRFGLFDDWEKVIEESLYLFGEKA